MEISEESDHAFVIRIWKEKREIQGALPTWRGVIEHVPTGKRRYLQDLIQIITFLTPYLEEMNLKIDLFWRWVIWMRSLKYPTERPPVAGPPAHETSPNE